MAQSSALMDTTMKEEEEESRNLWCNDREG
jgi:hypothetical protein